MDTESIISNLSSKWNQNSRNDVQSDLVFLFKNSEGWRTRAITGLSTKRFEQFVDFATYRTPWGLGWTKNVMEAFILPELSDIWKQIEGDIPMANKVGRPDNEEKVLSHLNNRGTGNRQYSIAVLKRDSPAIAEEVINGTITAAEGMRRAGKRKLMLTIPATIDGYYNSIQKNLTPCQIEELIQLLTNESIIRI